METALEKRQRIISLYIVHTSMFVFALGNSVIMMGVWPYLQAVRKSIIYIFSRNSVLMKSNHGIYIMTQLFVINCLAGQFRFNVPIWFRCGNRCPRPATVCSILWLDCWQAWDNSASCYHMFGDFYTRKCILFNHINSASNVWQRKTSQICGNAYSKIHCWNGNR